MGAIRDRSGRKKTLQLSVHVQLSGYIGGRSHLPCRVMGELCYGSDMLNHRRGIRYTGLGTDMLCGASGTGTGGAGYARVHRGNEPRGMTRGCEGLSVPG